MNIWKHSIIRHGSSEGILMKLNVFPRAQLLSVFCIWCNEGGERINNKLYGAENLPKLIFLANKTFQTISTVPNTIKELITFSSKSKFFCYWFFHRRKIDFHSETFSTSPRIINVSFIPVSLKNVLNYLIFHSTVYIEKSLISRSTRFLLPPSFICTTEKLASNSFCTMGRRMKAKKAETIFPEVKNEFRRKSDALNSGGLLLIVLFCRKLSRRK